VSVERADPAGPEWTQLAGPHLARYAWAAAFASGQRVLDVACGSGYGAALLGQAGAAHVLGLDREPGTVERARTRFGDARVEFRCGDAHELQALGQRFGLIVSFETIEHLDDPERFLVEMGGVLASGGTALLSTPDRLHSDPSRAGRPANPHHVREWDAAEFLDLLRAHFVEVEPRTQVRCSSVEARRRGVTALREALWWANPLASRLWRRLRRDRSEHRPWNGLDSLAVGTPAEYPIVVPALAAVFGTPMFLLAVCRQPRRRA
jgi:SAM-dependent methyltransferase